MKRGFVWVPSGTAAGVEVYTPMGDRATLIQEYLDFLATQELPLPRIRHIARVITDAATWIA